MTEKSDGDDGDIGMDIEEDMKIGGQKNQPIGGSKGRRECKT